MAASPDRCGSLGFFFGSLIRRLTPTPSPDAGKAFGCDGIRTPISQGAIRQVHGADFRKGFPWGKLSPKVTDEGRVRAAASSQTKWRERKRRLHLTDPEAAVSFALSLIRRLTPTPSPEGRLLVG